MYNQFTKNMNNFLLLNKNDEHNKAPDYRYNLVKEMEPLVDIDKFNELKEKNSYHYKKLSTLIWEIKEHISKYPAFKTFSWELWGYGFDGEFYNIDISKEELEEKLKLIDLLLSTQYWC